ncbi:hypothetical protein AB0J72_53595 [Dactylosporangium sp. NPDC049742]|uniref:hypothetical protein n=1 Tax=Dactylosporangium sp. NPDC049742 TaxID=3154737 RepID=UPI003438B07E
MGHEHVGVSHGSELDGQDPFFSHVHLHGWPAPVREYLPRLLDLILGGGINPGKVFDLELPYQTATTGQAGLLRQRGIPRPGKASIATMSRFSRTWRG